MFGPLPFVPMREEQNEGAQAAPFVLGTGDKLIHDDLGDVPKIAKLRFPEDQRAGPIQAVTVLKTKHADFCERTVEKLDRTLVWREIVQGDAGLAIFIIVQHRVA